MSHNKSIQKMFIYTTEYYSAVKHEDILNFSSKWKELENILSKVFGHKRTH